MILTPIRRYGAMILMLLTLVFSSEVLAKTHTTTASQKSHLTKASNKQVSSKQEYSRNSAKSSSLPDLRKYPSGTPRKKAFLRTVMPYITSQNAAITAERNWLISKQYQGQWSPAERARLKDIAKRYKVKWSGNNLFGMKCMKGRCTNAPGKVKGYSQFSSVKESVSAYVTNLNTHPAYSSFRKSRAQLRKADQEVTATAMIHKLKGYSTKGKSYNNYLFAMYQDNQRLIAAHM